MRKTVYILLVCWLSSAPPPAHSIPQEQKYRLSPTPDSSSITKVYVPENLEDTFKELEKMLSPELLKEMKEGKEQDMVRYHMGLGMWIRNNWQLWSGGRLAKYFNSIRIYHPDDMSGIILETFWCHLKGERFRLEERIAFYEEYWRLHAEPKDKRCPQDGSPIDTTVWLDDKTESGKQRVIQAGRCRKHKHLWAYEADKGWYKPDDALRRRIQGL